MTEPKKLKTYKLYKPTRQNYVETPKSLIRDAIYLGEVKLPTKTESK